MHAPEWLKPALYGALAGAAALAIVGFSWGGWVTGGKAEQIASDRARLEVVAALVPVCLEQSNQDPVSATTLASLMEARPHQRDRMLMDAGWATMPGATGPNSAVPRLHAGAGGTVLMNPLRCQSFGESRAAPLNQET